MKHWRRKELKLTKKL